MANSKRKCRNCKNYFRVDADTPKFIKWGSEACREALALKELSKVRLQQERARKRSQKAEKQVNAKRKREFRANDIRIRKPAAKKACHDYIKYRDRGKLCICCNKPIDIVNAGHWLESGNNPQVRYDENNIHSQKVDCNHYHGGDSGDYEKNLRIKIGDEAVDLLLTKKGGTVKRTGQDYAEIEKYYKQKLKDLESIGAEA